MSQIRKWHCKFFVIRLQAIPKFIIIHTFYSKIFANVQKNLSLYIKNYKIILLPFLLLEIIMEIIKLKT